MSYSAILKEYISKSGKTLDQIVSDCEKLGVNIHSTYISKLRLGQRPAPSDEISRALANVTGGDPEELIIAGYIERAPKEVQGVIKHYLNNLDFYTAIVSTNFTDDFEDIDLEDNEKFASIVEKNVNRFKSMPIEQRIDFVISHFNRMVNAHPEFLIDFGIAGGVSEDRIESTIKTMKEGSINRIKLYDLTKESYDEHQYEWVPITKILFDGEPVCFICPDDSMIGANITKGAKLICQAVDHDKNHQIDSGKIYVVGYKDEVIIRRVIYQKDTDLVILQPENSKYPLITTKKDSEDFNLFAIVKSVEFTLE
ncbi:S24 family peptidase [Brevibacillus sp. MER 51]|uniref:LexA family protein n=1 Tax=Brevibacillus sp. MER 51 TaxID=2939560 RepID=UPI00203DE1EB|nr:S24 family peptidase [Brevibacillus sp. MER 51]MCM3145348.1 S24 family peptidase [Brevibacillus sp. MER 51]